MEVDAAVDLPEPNKRPRLDEEGDAAAGDSAPTEPLEGAYLRVRGGAAVITPTSPSTK